jgi:hypothetical protein
MKYKKLGKLPLETIEFFKKELLARKIDSNYQWIQFDKYLNDKFAEIFFNTELKIQYDPTNDRLIQKAFYSAPGNGFRIHKDGHCCNSALNIAVSCNPGDWVRWYDDDLIYQLESPIYNQSIGKSRDISIMDYESIPHICELRNEIGDVYTLDVNTFHSFKCIGTEPRIVIQTKFQSYPTFATITELLSKHSFRNLISC